MATAFTPPALSSHEGPAPFVPPPLSSHEGAASNQQPSAAARFGVELLEGLGIAPAVRSAVKAVTHPMASLSDLKDAGISLLRLAAEAETNPSAAAVHMGEGIVKPIAEDVAAGNMAGAAGRATGNLLLMAAPEAGEIASGVGTAGRAVGAGVRAAAPDVAMGAAQIGAGELLGQIPGMEWPARIGMGYPGARQIATGLKAGFRAGRAATRAAEEIAPAELPTGFGVASGSTAAPTRGVPMTPGVIPDVAGALPGAPVAASTPVSAAPVEAPPPAAAMPSSVETPRAELEAQLRDGIARANGFKKGFGAIPEHNPARQKIEATAAAIARAEQGVPEAAAAPVAPPAAAAVTAVPPPPAAAPQPPLTGETPNQTPGVQLEPDFLRDEVRRQNTRARTMAEGSQEATAARASHVDDIVGSNRSNWVRKMARQFKNAGMTSEDAAALPAEDLDKVSQAVGVSPWSERSADTIDQFKAALDEMWKNAPKASQKVQDITTTGLGISGSEPTGIGGLMSRKPAAAPAPALAPEPPPVASSQPTTAGEMMQKSTPPAPEHWLNSLDPEAQESVFSVMRKVDNEAEAGYAQNAKLGPRYGEVAVGGAHMDPFFRAEAIRGFNSALGKGVSVEDAIQAGLDRSNAAIKIWNAKKGVDFTVQRPLDLERSRLQSIGREIQRAAKGTP